MSRASPSLHAVSVDLHVGSRLPAFCSAAGRAILAQLDEEAALAMLAAARRAPMTKRTVTDLLGLRAALAKVRELGYALNDQEAFVGDISIAAPLVNRAGEPVGAVNIAVPFAALAAGGRVAPPGSGSHEDRARHQ
jgi:IclR family pca regulon transcriptional regulator